MDEPLETEAAALVASLAKQCSQSCGFGSMSPSIYDTAWVSMIRKTIERETRWLFPECFESLLAAQLPDGSWGAYATQVDGILSTSAALFAVRKHLYGAEGGERDKLQRKSDSAESALRRLLEEWNVDDCDQVGFEVLVTQHLLFLEAEGFPSFEFQSRQKLNELANGKLKKLPPAYVQKAPTTLLHSLEALIGKIDFDQMRHLLRHGSMLGSPSSTAAYLMNVSDWDDEAESYLRVVLERKPNTSEGLVPCAWPTTIFELVWVLTALHEAGYSTESLGLQSLSTISSFLEDCWESQNGLVGFAPSYLADADDTARTMLALHSLGKTPDVKSMIASFEGNDHFRTYEGERNPSLTANCNVAAALLASPDPFKEYHSILKCINFLCNSAFEKQVNDKWNLNALYSIMLLAQTLLRFVTRIDEGNMNADCFPLDLLYQKIPIITFQLLAQVLCKQDHNGSWDSKHEVTAYAVLALTALFSFPWMRSMQETIQAALKRGKDYLYQERDFWSSGAYLWTEKVTYHSSTLSLAYCLSAAKACPVERSWKPPTAVLNDISPKTVTKLAYFFGQLPLFSQMPTSMLELASCQSHYFLKRLSQATPRIFPQTQKAANEYMKYVPFTWTAVNVQSKCIIPPAVIHDMVVLSVLIYQADEYMEAVIEKDFSHDLEFVASTIRSIFNDSESSDVSDSSSESRVDSVSDNKQSSAREKVKDVLQRFVAYVLNHKRAVQSHARLQTQLARELKRFLLAHVEQAADNVRFAKISSASADNVAFEDSSRTYYQWDAFDGPRQAYASEDLCRHLAAMCRQYNDYGSTKRDFKEGNLNSINFPEFSPSQQESKLQGYNIDEQREHQKKELMWIAEYERAGLNSAMAALDSLDVSVKTMSAVRLFVNVTDLYGQIYVQRDLTNQRNGQTMQPQKRKAEDDLQKE